MLEHFLLKFASWVFGLGLYTGERVLRLSPGGTRYIDIQCGQSEKFTSDLKISADFHKNPKYQLF